MKNPHDQFPVNEGSEKEFSPAEVMTIREHLDDIRKVLHEDNQLELEVESADIDERRSKEDPDYDPIEDANAMIVAGQAAVEQMERIFGMEHIEPSERIPASKDLLTPTPETIRFTGAERENLRMQVGAVKELLKWNRLDRTNFMFTEKPDNAIESDELLAKARGAVVELEKIIG